MRAHGVYIQSAMINQIAAWLRPVGSTEACAGGKTFSRRLPGARYAGATGIPGTTSSVPGPVTTVGGVSAISTRREGASHSRR